MSDCSCSRCVERRAESSLQDFVEAVRRERLLRLARLERRERLLSGVRFLAWCFTACVFSASLVYSVSLLTDWLVARAHMVP